MNKAELVNRVAKDSGISKAEAQRAVDSFTQNTMNAVKKGDKVTLVGFGTFSASQRSARKGRNPQTGEPLNIPARKVARFKAGKEFSNRVR